MERTRAVLEWAETENTVFQDGISEDRSVVTFCYHVDSDRSPVQTGTRATKQPILGYRDGWELLSRQRITDGGLDETSPRVSAFDYLLPSWLCCRRRFRKGALEGELREFKDLHHFEFALLPAWSWNLNCHILYTEPVIQDIIFLFPPLAPMLLLGARSPCHVKLIPNKQLLPKVSLVVVFSRSNWKAHHTTPMSQDLRRYSIL